VSSKPKKEEKKMTLGLLGQSDEIHRFEEEIKFCQIIY